MWTEIEAKLADRPQHGASRGINPHHLTNGRRRLLAEHIIEEVAAKTYGGRVVTILALRDRRSRQDAFRTAARRKRALEGQYLGWTESSRRRPNLIGNGGERVVLESLRATRAGYRLVNPGRGEVNVLFNEPVPGGSLDGAAHIALDAGEDLRGVTILVEVKNLRKWIYPASAALFQLLDKAAQLQLAHPRRRFLPVLVARRVHYTAFRMAKHLGFFLIQFDATAQPILPHWTVTPEQVGEVRAELGYVLALTDQAMSGVTARFDKTIPQVGLRMEER